MRFKIDSSHVNILAYSNNVLHTENLLNNLATFALPFSLIKSQLSNCAVYFAGKRYKSVVFRFKHMSCFVGIGRIKNDTKS